MISVVSICPKARRSGVPNVRTGHTIIQPEWGRILPSYYVEPEAYNWRDGGHCKNLGDEVDRM